LKGFDHNSSHSPNESPNEEKSIQRNGAYAIWKWSNGQKFLEVHAQDYYTLGFLQGEKLKKEIKRFKEIIKLFNIRYIRKDFSYEKFLEMAEAYEKFIPENLQKEMHGMADAIVDISYIDILTQNCFMDILYGHIIPKKMDDQLDSFDLGCTSLAVMSNKRPVIAQNFDYPYPLKSVAYFIHIITPNYRDIFSFKLGGLLGMPIALTKKISIRINIIKSNMVAPIKTPGTIRFRIGLEEANSVDEFLRVLFKEDMTSSGNLIISDRSKIVALEVLPKVHSEEEVEKYIVKTNTFISNSLQKYLLDKSYSKERQNYAEKRLKELYKKRGDEIGDLDLLDILSDNSNINRKNPLKPMTLAFLSNEHFGLGNPDKNLFGKVPISFFS